MVLMWTPKRKKKLTFGKVSCYTFETKTKQMKVLLKQAKVHDSNATYHGQIVDILISDGVINQIGKNIEVECEEIIEAKGLQVSQGWIDLKADFCEPGNEHKETLSSGSAAAERGGFTHVCVVPSTHPPVDNKAQVEFIKNYNTYSAVEIHPTGCISWKHEGKELAEMYDMSLSGAVYFTDDQKHVSTGLLYRALMYIKNFDAKIAVSLGDKSLNNGGQVNEGLASTSTGLKASPAIAEVIDIERNISLVKYTNSALHFSGLSTAEGVDLIREAKKQGLRVTADVHVQQLLFNEEVVLGFNSQYKVLPPYRTEEDRKALWQGLADGTIDAIVSDHRPAHLDDKEVEFDYASFGNITLETLFGSLVSCSEFHLDNVVRAITEGPAKILGLSKATIDVGQKADLTFFTLEESTIFSSDDVQSLSKNSPFIGKKLPAKIIGIMNQGRLVLNKSEEHA